MKKSISFFRKHTCHIDIVRDEKIYTVYFPKIPYCMLLPKDSKNDFHNDVDRTSSKTKLSFLMDETKKLIKTMEHEERLRIFFSYNPLIGVFARHGKLWEQCAFYTTISINLMVCMSYS
jgi:hypothetical protein